MTSPRLCDDACRAFDLPRRRSVLQPFGKRGGGATPPGAGVRTVTCADQRRYKNRRQEGERIKSRFAGDFDEHVQYVRTPPSDNSIRIRDRTFCLLGHQLPP